MGAPPDREVTRSVCCRQARRKNQAVCYRLIREARQRMRSEAADGAATAADVPATTNGETKAAPGGDELPLRRPGSALPPGGFISHLLSAENKLIGRKFTDMEVRSRLHVLCVSCWCSRHADS